MFNNKEFYEQYAVCIIGKLNSLFSNMQKGESPDFYNDQIGLEVTRAISKTTGELDAFWKNNTNRYFDELPSKQLQKLGFIEEPKPTDSNEILFQQRSKRNGSMLYIKEKATNRLILCCYMGPVNNGLFSSDEVLSAITSKLSKLNNHYRQYMENDVVIIIQDQLNYMWSNKEIIDQEITSLIEKLQRIYVERNSILFDNIYLLFLDNVFSIDTRQWKYKQNVLSQAEIAAATQFATGTKEAGE